MSWHPEYEAAGFLRNKIEAALGAGISGAYLDLIPESATLPAVRYSFMTRENTMTNGQAIVQHRLRSQVLVVGRDLSVVAGLAATMTDVLHGANGVVPSGLATVLACTFMETLTMTEQDRGGGVIRHGGGIFRIDIQSDTSYQP